MNFLRYSLISLIIVFSMRLASASEPIWVVGHKVPDTDAIVSAISVAKLKSSIGVPAVAKAQGEPNPETEYILKRFGFTAPPVTSEFKNQRVILVDHADYDQAPDDIRDAKIVGIIDHHKLGGIETDEPLEVVMKPYGCVNTVIFELFLQNNVAIDGPLAGIMLGAILSDTRVFSSPTTTSADKRAASALAEIAGITSIELFGRELLDAFNRGMQSMSDRELITMDMKLFRLGSARVGIAQIEAFDLAFLLDRVSALQKEMNIYIKEKELDAFVLALTNVGQAGSFLIIEGPQASKVRAAFNISSEQLREAWKEGLMSRKKQLVPSVQRAFAK